MQILIQGASGYLVETPDRYELRNVTKAMVISRIAGSASDVPVKEKWMSQLTDDDIYTYVTLKDVEFPVRKGAITPINEGYAIGTGASRISKYPLLVRDINGDDMYMLTNTNCAYRSDGTRLPYGSGKISGVIVHERFSRFEWRDGADPAEMDDDPTLGFIGRYQIRHQTKGDIWDNMQNSVEDSFSALLTEYRYWNPDKENKVQKPTYGTNGYLTHTYQEKYTGSASKEYLQATFQQHMWGGGTYEYLGPVGNNASYIFGANFGNKNGIGVVIDPAKESWNPLMDDLVSRNPDGTLEWCGPYAKDKNAANGTGGWPGNNEFHANQLQRQHGYARQGECIRFLLHRLRQPLLVGRRHRPPLRLADQLLDRRHHDIAYLDADFRYEHAAELLLAPFLVCRMVADRFAGRKGRLAVESDRRIHHPRRFRLGEHALFVVRSLQKHRLRASPGDSRPRKRLHPASPDERPLQRRLRLRQRAPEPERQRRCPGRGTRQQPRIFRHPL